ncbi:MAG: carboxypeptidase regulatory-like domain-containing protein, partial [Litorilinea sp.]
MQKSLLLILTLLLTSLPQPSFGQAPQTLAPVTGAPTTLGPLVGTDGNLLDGVSANPALSADGNVIIFAARATNLLDAGSADPRFDFWQIYAYDRAQDAMTRVSSGPGGQPGNGSSGGSPPVVSADGNLVAFASRADNLVFGDSNDAVDIFVYDRAAAQMARVSVTSAGGQGTRDSYLPAIAADGNVVAFVSQARNLVADDTNSAADIFVHDRRTGQTQRVSVSSTGAQANGTSGISAPALSADGRYVAFASLANNLVPGDTNNAADVFIHDRQTGHTQRVSVRSAGAQADGASTAPTLSGDGRYVAFLSSAPNLASGDPAAQTHVYLHDRQTRTTVRISTTHDGAPANGQSFAPALSADGRYVAFAALADNLVPNDSNLAVDIFLHDGLSGQIERVSLTAAGGQSDGLAWRPALGGYGRYVAFEANASNLTAVNLAPEDAPTRPAIYLRDRGAQSTGAYTLTGQILGPDDEPVSGLAVQVGLRFPRQTQTDGGGRFGVDNLPAGDYAVAIDAPNYLLDPPFPQTVTVGETIGETGGETQETTLAIRAYPCVGPGELNLCALRAGDILLALTPDGADWPQVGGT